MYMYSLTFPLFQDSRYSLSRSCAWGIIRLLWRSWLGVKYYIRIRSTSQLPHSPGTVLFLLVVCLALEVTVICFFKVSMGMNPLGESFSIFLCIFYFLSILTERVTSKNPYIFCWLEASHRSCPHSRGIKNASPRGYLRIFPTVLLFV
jgi:hypothetical protein